MNYLSRSKIFLYILVAFVLGIFLGSYIGGVSTIAILLTCCIAILFLFLPIPKIPKILIILLISVFLGIGRYQSFLPKIDEHHIAFYNDSGERLEISGVVADEPAEKGNSFELKISNIQSRVLGTISNQYPIPNDQLVGKILLTVPKYYKVSYGDVVRFNAKLQTPQSIEAFDYQEYLARYGVYSIAKSVDDFEINANYRELSELTRIEKIQFFIGANLYKIKNYFSRIIQKIYPEPHAAFMLGLLVGAKKGLPDWLLNIFQIVGITHIIAISGYNITILARLAEKTLGKIGRKLIFWGVLAMILAFVIMTGAQASIVRAGIMGALLVYAGFIGRRGAVVNILIFAGAVMIFLNPLILRSDVGFQLSFLATLGLVYISPIFESWFKKLPNAISQLLSATLAAQVLTLPIIISSFGLFSLVAPIANILILPFIPMAMLFGFVSGILGIIWLPLGRIVGFLGYIILEIIIKIAELLSQIPYAAVEFRLDEWWIWSLYYIAVMALICVWYKKRKIESVYSRKI